MDELRKIQKEKYKNIIWKKTYYKNRRKYL